jgi:hypothetical protein
LPTQLFLDALLGQIDNCRVGSGFLDRLNTLLGVGFLLVCLAGGDDLAVGCLGVEPKLAGFVLSDLELGCRGSSPRSFPRTVKALPVGGFRKRARLNQLSTQPVRSRTKGSFRRPTGSTL